MGPSSTFLSQTSVYWKVYQNITNKTYTKSTFSSLTLTTQVYSPVPFVRNLTMSVVSSKFFSRISFPQFSPLVADEVHKITQVLHFQACFLAPIEEKWLVLSDSSAPAHQKHWWFCRYLCSCQVKETFRTTSLMIYKIKYMPREYLICSWWLCCQLCDHSACIHSKERTLFWSDCHTV